MSEEIRPADKAYRLKIAIIFALVMLAVAAIAQWGVPMLIARLQLALDAGDGVAFQRCIFVMETVMALLFLGFLPFCVYNIRMGLLVRREQRYPSSRMRVLRDTPVLTGESAARRGKLLVVMGVILMLVSVMAAVFAVLIIESIVAGVNI